MIDISPKNFFILMMYRLEVDISCRRLEKDLCDIVRRALEPDNKAEGLSIEVSCKNSSIHIVILGERVGSVRAAYNDLSRALTPLLELFLENLGE